MVRYIIPARAGSKRFPHKNQKLFNYTASIIPYYKRQSVIVTTDDIEIIEMSHIREYEVRNRPAELCNDVANVRAVLSDIVEHYELVKSDVLVLLYLTYPKRSWEQVENILAYFYLIEARSLLCRMPVKTHPYMCIDENGKQIIKHNMYRCQDYPDVYEISHCVGMFRVDEISKLNNNLYNGSTRFYDIHRTLDVDYEDDMRSI